jgi:phage gpG-like protein
MLNIYVEGLDKARFQLGLIKSPSQQKRILSVAAREVIKAAKRHTSKQIDVDGKPFGNYSTNTRHKRPRPRNRKMLHRIVKNLRFWSENNYAVVGWSSPVEGGIAAKQQFGFSENFTKEKLVRRINKEKEPHNLDDSRQNLAYYKKSATKQQARSLLQAGYKARVKGKGYKTPTMKWIMQNLSIGQAGYILHVMRGSKEKWTINLPARPFLGLNNEDAQIMIDALTKALNSFHTKEFS